MRLVLTRFILTSIFVAMSAGAVMAQGSSSGTVRDQLVGTWSFVSSTSERDDGSNTWGPNAKGQIIFANNGRFSFQLMRSDRPRYKSNTRMRGSLIENQATSRGTLSYFGTFAVSEADRTLTYNIESSSFPNFNGTAQKRTITFVGDELRYENPAPARGTKPNVLVWKRVN